MFLTKSKEESYIMQERKDIERQKSNKDSLIETSDERSMERQVNRILKLTNLKETLRKKLEKERGMIRKEKEDDSLINKGWKNDSFKKSDSLKEKIDERLKSIERSMIYIQNNSLAELTKKIEILISPLDIDRKRDIIVLNTIESSNNEKNNKHTGNTICHKCKQYGHTKKQCDRHDKIVKYISKLEFEKDVINELMEMFDVKQKGIDQVTKKKELKSTNPLKVNKKKKEGIITLYPLMVCL